MTVHTLSPIRCDAVNYKKNQRCEENSAPHPHKSSPYINLICLSDTSKPEYILSDGIRVATYKAALCKKHQNLAKHAVEIFTPDNNILICSENKRIEAKDIKNNPHLVLKTKLAIAEDKKKAKEEAIRKSKMAKFEKYKEEVGFNFGTDINDINSFIELVENTKKGDLDSMYKFAKFSYEVYEHNDESQPELLKQAKDSLYKVYATVNGNKDLEKQYCDIYLYIGVIICKDKKYTEGEALLNKYQTYDTNDVAQYYLGEIALENKNYTKAKELLLPLAEQGDIDSIKLLEKIPAEFKLDIKISNPLENAKQLIQQGKSEEGLKLLAELSDKENEEATELFNQLNLDFLIQSLKNS